MDFGQIGDPSVLLLKELPKESAGEGKAGDCPLAKQPIDPCSFSHLLPLSPPGGGMEGGHACRTHCGVNIRVRPLAHPVLLSATLLTPSRPLTDFSRSPRQRVILEISINNGKVRTVPSGRILAVRAGERRLYGWGLMRSTGRASPMSSPCGPCRTESADVPAVERHERLRSLPA